LGFPNPFNPRTVIRYSIPEATPQGKEINRVVLAVYDLVGREVAVLVNAGQRAGDYEVTFDAAGLAGGVYLCRLQVDAEVLTRTLLLIR